MLSAAERCSKNSGHECQLKGGILSHALTRMTAPSAEGASGGVPPRKASPERGGARHRRAEGFRLPRAAMVTAALSAAVTSTPKQKNAPTSHGRTSREKKSSLFPATLRERGSGGEVLLLEKQPLPQHLPNVISWGGSAREGASLQRSPLPRTPLTPKRITSITALRRLEREFCRREGPSWG